jgi:hypothetical protein
VQQSSEQILRKRFGDFVTRNGGRLQSLIETTKLFRSRGWTAFAFGGTPRGVYGNGLRYSPRDVDLVFDDEHFPFFETVFHNSIKRRNSFGGLHLQIGNLAIDAWPLSATWAFREGYVGNPSFEKLPSTTFLNIDGIIVEMVPSRGKQRRIFEHGFFSGWQHKTLDINFVKNPYPSICVARTLHISKHFGFQLSNRLAKYILEMLGRLTVYAIENAQLKHYGFVEFDARWLIKIRQQLDRHLNANSLLPIALFSPAQMELKNVIEVTISPLRKSKEMKKEAELCNRDEAEEIFMGRLIRDTFDMRRGIFF